MANKKTAVDLAVVQTDLKWIREKLTSMENTMNNIHACTSDHDNRLLSLEEWKKICNEAWNRNMIKWGLIISSVSLVASVIISIFVR